VAWNNRTGLWAAFSTLKELQINVKREILTTHFSETGGVRIRKLQQHKTQIRGKLPGLQAAALAKFAFRPGS
jgi:hypothetical protein